MMMALGADQVIARDSVVLNPHYRTMGLYGSEYWTYLLPRRVGDRLTRTMTTECLPIGAREAVRTGLADLAVPGHGAQFDRAVSRFATQLAAGPGHGDQLAAKRDTRAAHEQERPLRSYRRAELDQMRLDIFADRNGFAQARRRFLTSSATPTPRSADEGRLRIG